MSAFLVSKKHIQAMVYAGMKGHLIPATDLLATGRMLWEENLRSVAARYSEESRAKSGWTEEAVRLSEEDFPLVLLPEVAGLPVVALIKACDCYNYQSCEHEGWQQSAARAFSYNLRDWLCHSLPGYKDAQWEIYSLPGYKDAQWEIC
jgi:hypothetical protein